MKVQSKIHWIYFPISIFLITFGLWLLIFMLNSNDEKAKELPNGVWIFVGFFCSMTIGTGVLMFNYLKKIIIENNSLTIKQLFRKELNYALESIIGYSESDNLSRTGNYRTFYFKTNDEKIYFFSSNEFSNYAELSGIIASKCSSIEIGKYHNLKKVLTILLSVFVIIGILIIIKLGNVS